MNKEKKSYSHKIQRKFNEKDLDNELLNTFKKQIVPTYSSMNFDAKQVGKYTIDSQQLGYNIIDSKQIIRNIIDTQQIGKSTKQIKQNMNDSKRIEQTDKQYYQQTLYHLGKVYSKVKKNPMGQQTQTPLQKTQQKSIFGTSQTSMKSRQFIMRPATAISNLKTEITLDNTDQLQYYFGSGNLITMQKLENYQLNQFVRSGIYNKQDKTKSIRYFTQNSEDQISKPIIVTKKDDNLEVPTLLQKFHIKLSPVESSVSDQSFSKESIIEDNGSKNSSSQKSVIVQKRRGKNLRNIINSRFSQIMDLAQKEVKVSDIYKSPKFNAHEKIMLFQNSLAQYSHHTRSNSQKNISQPTSDVLSPSRQKKRDSGDRGQIVRRIGVRIQQGDSIVKTFSQVHIPYQSSQTPEDVQTLQTIYLEATEELKCSSISLQSILKQSQNNTNSQVSQNYKTMWVPSFEINFMYKSMLNFWQVKLVSPPSTNGIKVYMFDQTNNNFIYQFQLPDLQINQILQKNQTLWPEITNILLQKVQDLGCQQINRVLEKQNQLFIKPRKSGKYEMQNIKNLLQILTQNLVFQQKKVNGMELQFLPSKYNEIDGELNFYEFMESTKLLYNKLNQYEKTKKRNCAIQLNVSIDQILYKKKQELIKSNCRLLQQIIQFRFDSQEDQNYLLQVEPIMFNQLLYDADFLEATKILYGKFALIRISIRLLRQVNLDLEFHNDNFEIIFDLILLPKSKSMLQVNPHKIKSKQRAFHTSSIGKKCASLQITTLCLKLGAIIKIMEDQQNQFGLLNLNLSLIKFHDIIFNIINEKRQSTPFLYVMREFIYNKMCINYEKQELSVKMNIFSTADAVKLEAAGLALGFQIQKKPTQTPYAITEIERYILEEANKQAPTEKKLYNFNPESLFQRNFQDISDQDYKQKRENIQIHRSLHDIVKEYQARFYASKGIQNFYVQFQDPVQSNTITVKKNPKQVGNLDIYSDFPYDPNQTQEKNHSKINQIFAQQKISKNDGMLIRNNNFSVSVNVYGVITVKLYSPFKNQLVVCNVDRSDKEYEELMLKIRHYVQQGNSQIMKLAQVYIKKQVINKMYERYGGFNAFKMLNEFTLNISIQEIPPYNMLKSYMLNQFDRLMSLFRYKNLLLVHKLKKYGIFQVNVHLFYSLSRELNEAYDNSNLLMDQERLYLTDGNYFLLRLDIQQFDSKVGKTKIILNHFDIEKYLGIQIFQEQAQFRMTQNLLKLVTEQNAKFFTNQTIEAVATNVLQLLVFGRFRLTLIPYFSEVQLIFQQNPLKFSQQDQSKSSQSQLDSGERKRYHSINADNSNLNKGQKINNQVAQLRRINNDTQDSDFQLNKDLINKNFLEHFIKNSRLILNQVKKVYSVYNRHTQALIKLSMDPIPTHDIEHSVIMEFATFSIYRNLLTNSWFLILYIPKTSRRLVAIINSTDILEGSGNKLSVFQPIQYKDSIRDTPDIKLSFKELDKLCDRSKLSAIMQLRSNSFNLRNKSNTLSSFKSDDINFFRRSEKRLSLNGDLIIKQGLNLNDMITEFFALTDIVSECLEFSVYTFIMGQEKSLKLLCFLEKKMWMNILNSMVGLKLHKRKDNDKKTGLPNSSELISLNLGSIEISMGEFLCSHYMRIERIGEAQVEFFIKYEKNTKSSASSSIIQSPKSATPNVAIKVPLKQESLTTLEQPRRLALVVEKMNIAKQPMKFMGLIQEAKEADEQIKFARKINVFQAFEGISYASSSNFNIELRYFSFNQLQEATQSVNLRELLNLYIADGYYKYQTTYMNSKLSLSDIHNICKYVIYKIKTQNFLNLTQYHMKEENLIRPKEVILVRSDASSQSLLSVELPYVRTFYYKPNNYLITIKLYSQRSRVDFQLMNLKNQNITKEKLSYKKLDSIIQFFIITARRDYKIALNRIQLGMNQILRLFNPQIIISP